MAFIVAITGKEGAGKSTILTNIACALADENTTVGVLSTDLRWQQLPVLLAGSIIKSGMSLGDIMTHESLVGGFAEYPHCPNLFVGAPVRGEKCFDKEPGDRHQLEKFMYLLSSTFDYVLIEANTIFFNQFSAVALRMCNACINVTEATELGMSFELTNYVMLELFRPDVTPIDILNADDGDMSQQEAAKRAGHGFTYVLPYHKQIRQSATRCMPVYIDSGLNNSTITSYRKKITAIAETIREGAEIAAEAQRRRNAAAARKANARRRQQQQQPRIAGQQSEPAAMPRQKKRPQLPPSEVQQAEG